MSASSAGAPLVSVCLITYNQAKFIQAAVLSAVEQDYPNLEVVVADDGSTDGTAAVLETLAERYPERIRQLPIEPNRGIAGIVRNYNRALKAARGKYIALLDGDDEYLPGKIRAQVAWMEADERRVLCGHDVEFFDSQNGKALFLSSQLFPLRGGHGASDIIRRHGPYALVATMVRASALPTGGFDDRLRILLDWKLWIDCLVSGGEFGYVAGVYARYRKHEGNLTNSFDQIRRDDQFATLALVESKNPELAADCLYARAQIYYGLGITHLKRDEARAARQCFRSAIQQQVHLKAALMLGLCYLPGALSARLSATWIAFRLHNQRLSTLLAGNITSLRLRNQPSRNE